MDIVEQAQADVREAKQRLQCLDDTSDDDFAKVKEDLPKPCVVSKVIQQSGTDITTAWNVTRP